MRGIRELKRSSENNPNCITADHYNSSLTKMDQEIIQKYKIKALKMEEEIRNVKEDYESLKRNFDALTFKAKNDVEKIRQLEEEINIIVLNSKLNNNQIDNKELDESMASELLKSLGILDLENNDEDLNDAKISLNNYDVSCTNENIK